MHPLIQEIEERLDYIYKTSKSGEHIFVQPAPFEDKLRYHHFVESTCDICEKPYMKRKYGKSNSHVRCANIMKSHLGWSNVEKKELFIER